MPYEIFMFSSKNVYIQIIQCNSNQKLVSLYSVFNFSKLMGFFNIKLLNTANAMLNHLGEFKTFHIKRIVDHCYLDLLQYCQFRHSFQKIPENWKKIGQVK